METKTKEELLMAYTPYIGTTGMAYYNILEAMQKFSDQENATLKVELEYERRRRKAAEFYIEITINQDFTLKSMPCFLEWQSIVNEQQLG